MHLGKKGGFKTKKFGAQFAKTQVQPVKKGVGPAGAC